MDGACEGVKSRAAQYVRMSTDHQQYSTQNQSDKIREYAEMRGIHIVRTYADEGRSGLSIGGRAALQRLIADVETGNADFGIAGGRHVGFLYAHGAVLKKVPQAELVDELFREIDKWIAAGKPSERAKEAFGKLDGVEGPTVTMVGAAE